jgi:hypothetical protein
MTDIAPGLSPAGMPPPPDQTIAGPPGPDQPRNPHIEHPDRPPSDRKTDAELAAYCRQLFYKAREHRRPIIATWNRNDRLLRNRTWMSDRAAWLPSPEVPEIRPIVSQLAGWMTDQRPTYRAVAACSPHAPYYQEISAVADDLSTVIQSVATIHGHEPSIKQAIWDSYAWGTGIFKTAWDMSLDGGLGNALLLRVDPYTFYPDPQATNLKDGNYYIEARNMSRQEIDRRYRAANLFPDGNLTDDIDIHPDRLGKPSHASNKTFPGQIKPLAPSTRPAGLSTRFSPGNPDPNDLGITVLECWLREHTTMQVAGKSSLFDYWRCVVVAGNHVLMDVPAYDLWSHATHPYHRFVADDTGEFWGQSLVEDLASSQITLNRLLSATLHNIELCGNPPFLEGGRSGLPRTRIPNRPGTRLTVTGDINQAKWMEPVPLHPIIPQLIQFYVTEMERISGLSAINRGFTPTGRNASDVLDSVQEAGFTRIRSHLRSLEWALRSAYDQIATLIVENYDVPRFIAITGPDGTPSAQVLNAKHFNVPSLDKDNKPVTYPLRFTITSQIGQHISVMQKRAETIQLFTLGLLDPLAALSDLEIPGAEKIANRIAQLTAAQAMQPPGARQKAGRSS